MKLSIENISSLTDHIYFRRLKSYLVDKNIYDLSELALPYGTDKISLKIEDSIFDTYHIVLYRKDNNGTDTIILDTSFTGTSYTFEIDKVLGDSQITLEVNGTKLNSVYFSCYNIHTFIYTLAEKFLEIAKVQLQDKQDMILVDQSVTGFGESFDISSDGISNFGKIYKAFFLARFFDSSDPNPEEAARKAMLQFVYNTVLAYTKATSRKALDLLVEGLYGDSVFPIFVDYYKQRNFYPTVYNSTNSYRRGKLYLDPFPTPTKIVWDSFNINLGGLNYSVPAGSYPISGSHSIYYYFYFDGTPSAAPVVQISTSEPQSRKTVITDFFNSTEILVDNYDGDITGYRYGKYVELTQIPYDNDAIVLISNTGSYDLNIDGQGVSIIKNTNYVFLGTSEEVSQIGNITIKYYSDYEVFILGRYIKLRVGPTTFINQVEGCFRISEETYTPDIYLGGGLISRSVEMWQHGFELLIPNVITSALEKSMLLNLITNLKPAHKLGYIFAKAAYSDFPRSSYPDGTLLPEYIGSYRYYHEGYEFIGKA